MLRKLLKYDLKWTYKNLTIFYLLTFIFAILTRIFLSIDNSTIFNIIGKICSGTTITLMINIIINNMIRTWVRFTKNLYGDESYLTHTLPIKRKTVYISKFLLAAISMFTSFLVILICLFICYYSKENLQIVKNALDLIATTYDSTVTNLIIYIFTILFLEMLFILLIGYTGIIIGHRFNNGKVSKSVLFGILIYFMIQAVSLALIFLFGIINPNIMKLFTSNEIIGVNAIKTVLLGGALLYLVYIIGLEIANRKLFCKGINVD